MPKNKEIEVTLALKDEATKKIQSARATIKEFANATKDTLQPVTQLRSAWLKFGLAYGIIIGTIIKGMKEIAELNKEIKELDASSVKLGITTEQLSKRIYGFNIATSQAKIGSSITGGFFQTMGNVGKWPFVQAGEFLGEKAIEARAAHILRKKEGLGGWIKGHFKPSPNYESYHQEAVKELLEERRQRFLKSKEGVELETGMRESTLQLNLSAYAYKKHQLGFEVTSVKDYADKQKLAEYALAAIKRNEEDKTMEYRKQSANRLKIEGDTLAAMRIEQTNALIEYKRQFGDDGELVKDFIAGQEAMYRQAKLTYLGLKNEFQIYHDAYVSTIHSMTATFSDVFYKTITGEIKSLSETMREFGRTVMKILSDMVANFVITQAIIGIGNLFMPKGAGPAPERVAPRHHFGGPVYAHAGLATDDIPVIARRGEGFLTQTGMANIGGADNLRRLNHGESSAGMTVIMHNHIHAIDAQSFVQMLQKYPNVYRTAVIEGFVKNDEVLRGASKRYGR